MIGRLAPGTGVVKLVTVRECARLALRHGYPVQRGCRSFAEFGTNKDCLDIDPDTMTIHEHVLPHAGTRPRRLAVTSDDLIWYSDYARGYLGRYDPKRGVAQEWASPGGATSQPYGITALHDIIWYSESGVQPNSFAGRVLIRSPRGSRAGSFPRGGGVVHRNA